MRTDRSTSTGLNECHLVDLRRSGLSDETIAAAGLHSLCATEVREVTGVDGGPGLAIPYSGAVFSDGAPYVRVRLDRPLPTGDGRTARYLTKRGERNRLYVPSALPPSVLTDPSLPLAITEGEKKALKACQEGISCVGLAGVWCWKTRVDGRSAPLPDLDVVAWRGRPLAIVFDSDSQTNPHVRAAEAVLAAELSARGAEVRVVALPPGTDGQKVGLDDYLLSHTADDLRTLISATPLWEAAAMSTENASNTPASWPEAPAPEAFSGLAGDFVRAIEPHTEADPAALLISFFVAFGSVVGRGPRFVADAAKHYTNLNVVLVGQTARGRKGSSWAQVRRPLETVDSDWASDRIQFGLSSGEGLIWAVRDQMEKREPVRRKGQAVDYEDVVVDAGVEDKRLLIIEQEFASVLRVMARDGNTLSATIRQAWDTGDLRILTKNSPAQATDAHISIIGHVTRDEVLRYLGTTEAGNGFANRFLWVCVRRSKLLPEGGRAHEEDFVPLVRRMSAAVEFARSVGEMTRDDDARGLWIEIYPTLSQEMPGLLGAVTARSEAQTMRLACVYALLDQSPVIRREHLEAALAVWRYCEESARFIFGDALGDPVTDTILRALRQAKNGLTRTQISHLFKGNRAAADIAKALAVLLAAGLAVCRPELDTGGRPAERWCAIGPGQQAQSQPTKETNETS